MRHVPASEQGWRDYDYKRDYRPNALNVFTPYRYDTPYHLNLGHVIYTVGDLSDMPL